MENWVAYNVSSQLSRKKLCIWKLLEVYSFMQIQCGITTKAFYVCLFEVMENPIPNWLKW